MALYETPVLQDAKEQWSPAARAMFRAAQAVSHVGGRELFQDLVRELADILQAATVFIAVFTDDTCTQLHTLAAVLDGKPLHNFDYPLEGSPCAKVVGGFRYVSSGIASEFPPGTMFRAKGMDAYAAFPLNDSGGAPLGLLVAMDRRPVADAALAEALLKIFAGRIVAEIERSRADEALRAAALAVSSPRGESVFVELARYLATILRVESACIARFDPADPQALTVEAMVCDGQTITGTRYALEGTACATVLGQAFRIYPSRLRELFPADGSARIRDAESYAGVPLWGSGGSPLGIISIASRQPLGNRERIESMLQIFAVRAGSEFQQLRARESLRRSAANYRAIFDAAEDSIFVHDWDTGAILDVNPKACETYGYGSEELKRLSVADVSSGMPPYTAEQARQYMGLAKLGRCPPFEWQRRNKDGSLHWDEVRLKPAQIDGRAHILTFTREITERKAALLALQAREEQYRAIFDSSADAMGLWSAELRLVDVNQAFTRISGWTRADVIGQRLSDRPGEPEVERRAGMIRAALDGHEGRIEVQVPRKDGTHIDVETRYVPVRFGGVGYALSIARDITERRAALAALEAREEQYRAIFEAASDGFVLWDKDLTVVDVNPAALRLYGFTREQVIGKGYPMTLPEEHRAERLQLIRRALEGETVQIETAAVRARAGGDRSSFDIDLRVMPFRHRGEPHALAVVRDISERRERERQLHRSEARLRATVEAAFDCVIGMDGAGRIVEFNAAAERCFGHRREAVLGRPLAEVILPHRHRAAHTRGLTNFSSSRRGPMIGRLVETTALRADGTEIPVELAISVAEVPEGSIFVGHLRDISARRAAEAERAGLEAQLRQAQKMEAIGQLTGGIAHDFNNILTSVLGYLVLGQDRAEALGDAKLSRQLGQAELAAKRARELIAQMLAFARQEHGARRTVHLPKLVRQSLLLLRPTLPATILLDALSLEALPAEGLPPVHADAVQIEQVLFNLCINARDAMEGSGVIRVSLDETDGTGLHCAACGKTLGSGRWVELCVADTGSGVPPEVLRRMFEPFFTTKEVGRGSGMGLAMVHGIVHEHGGHVVVETAAGRGSAFRVLLPADEDAGAEPATIVPALRKNDTQLAGRVLVVEDEVMVGDFIAELLAEWGLEPVVLRDPQAALAWLEDEANHVDLLITDQTMPKMTGLELARRCSALRPTLPVVLQTGNPEGIDASLLERAGVRRLLHKPIETAALRDALQRCLGPRDRPGS